MEAGVKGSVSEVVNRVTQQPLAPILYVDHAANLQILILIQIQKYKYKYKITNTKLQIQTWLLDDILTIAPRVSPLGTEGSAVMYESPAWMEDRGQIHGNS